MQEYGIYEYSSIAELRRRIDRQNYPACFRLWQDSGGYDLKFVKGESDQIGLDKKLNYVDDEQRCRYKRPTALTTSVEA